jgi:hypothetical protein
MLTVPNWHHTHPEDTANATKEPKRYHPGGVASDCIGTTGASRIVGRLPRDPIMTAFLVSSNFRRYRRFSIMHVGVEANKGISRLTRPRLFCANTRRDV